MNHEELNDHYELYAIGVAGEPERSEIREHLSRGCEVCMKEMKRARAITAVLSATAAPAAPSAKLRRRIMASVGVEQRGFWWTPVLAAATALSIAAAVYFGGRESQYVQEVARLQTEARQQNIELTRLNEAFVILNGPETSVTSFGTGERQPPKGRVFVNPRQGVLLIASNLPPAPTGKIYEMWVIPKGGNPVPAGIFQSESDGTAMHVQRGPVDLSTTAAVAVTLENEGGTDKPTLPPVFAAGLQ